MTKNWKIFAQRTAQIEKRYIPFVKKVITNFRNSFIQDLKSGGANHARNELSKALIDERMYNVIRKLYREAGLMGAQLQYSELPKLSQLRRPRRPRKSLQLKANGSMGRNEQWIRAVQDYLKLHQLDLVSNMTETMKGDILRVLEKGIEKGWSIDEIVNELRRIDIIEARARTIARTEVIRAANVGHSVAAQSMPYETNKKWNAAQDHRTRHSHRYIHNHVVDENGFFDVPVYKGDKKIGTERMLYPGDPKASPENTINCRCRVLYVPKTDSNGNLIMRNPNLAPVIPMRSPAQSPAASGIAAVLKSSIHIGVEEK